MAVPSGASNAAAGAAADEVLWTYRGASEDAEEADYFARREMADKVVEQVKLYLRPGTPIWVGRELHLRIERYSVQARLVNVAPLLATTIGPATRVRAEYRARPRDQGQDISTFIAETIRYPNAYQGQVYASLVGIETIQKDLFRKLSLLLKPSLITSWVRDVYPQHAPTALMQLLNDRYPLVILEGEVGSGKTALARSIGHPLAETLKLPLLMYVVNAQVRGGGHVGELTQNLARAFTEAERAYEREQIPVLILIDEADALAQARGGRQRHHEDDAGVNTLIQRVDRLRGKPIGVIFATNLVQELDAAIMRRALAAYHFDRPTPAQRAEVFRRVLKDAALSEREIAALVNATEPRPIPGLPQRSHRYTYSDLTQRVLPTAVEEALWDQKPLSASTLLHACGSTLPTPEMSRHE